VTVPNVSPRFVTNLQAVRLIAAYLVLFRHSFILFGEQSPLAAAHLPQIGIWVFFAVSGYLLPGSWQRAPRLGPYLRARALRLLPLLATVVLLSMFVLGPLFTKLGLGEYLVHPQTWSYLGNLVFRPSYFLPAVFEDNFFPSAVNGSLWSLPPQALGYVLVPLVFLLRQRALRIVAWAIIFLLAQWDHASGLFAGVVVWGNSLSQVMSVIAVFAAGALLRELRVEFRLGVAGALLAAYFLGSWLIPELGFPLLTVALPYAVLTVGLRSWPVLRAANRLPDISYGVFLVGFPVQQSMIAFAPGLHPYPSILITVALSTVVALALERFVERPILARFARGASKTS
jgi:peptidoglycan/LPS O-acetylase OafA/YrhL